MDADAEVQAMAALVEALVPLDDDARDRVLGWAAARFATSPSLKSIISIKGENAGSVNDQNGEDQKVQSGKSTDFGSLVELFDAASPSTEAEKALVGAYWIQIVDGENGDFESQPVNDALKNLGHGIGNITREFDRLIGAKPALVLQVQKQGSTKQARKRYKLTTAGIRKVTSMAKDQGA